MKKKFYLTLDTETATLPFAYEYATTAKQKQNIAIAKPLVYDIGWCISDSKGNILKKENYLIQEIFFVPNVFNTAYYKDKRNIYLNLLAKNEIKVGCWNDVIGILLEDLRKVDIVCAYNATFDFKKAIPFTERYIKALYSNYYNEWEKIQRGYCKDIAKGKNESENPDFLAPSFNLRDEDFPIVDLWGLACNRLINIDRYRNYCLENDLLTNSAQFFKSSAETCFQYLSKQYNFIEEHTALSDSLIEAEILTKAIKKGKINPQIIAFPFRELGTTKDYVLNKKRKYLEKLIEAYKNYIDSYTGSEKYLKKIMRELETLQLEFEK